MRHIELVVDGMGCRRCVREVTARLRDVAGVVRVTADASTSTVTLLGTMTEVDVMSVFVGTGYVPRRVAGPAA
jgi:copper chaperone CopZ